MQDFTSVDLESLGVAKPYSMEAEQSVLGAALLESESVLPELVESLRPEMFYVRQNGEIFSEMVRLFTAGERVDLVTLLDAVVAAGVFESPDAAKVYLARLGETVPSISNVGAYARIVQEKFVSRQVLEVAQSILQQSGEAPSAELLLENAEQKLYEIRSGREQNSLTKLSAALAPVKVECQEGSFSLGGFILQCSQLGLRVDCSFDNRLDELAGHFAESFGLSLSDDLDEM